MFSMISKLSGLKKNNGNYSEFPGRVVRAIHDQQDSSERFVGWFQLTVVIVFGLLYSVASKPHETYSTFTLVPWFLGVYLLLTVTRIILAYRGRMSVSILYTSVVVDMGLLLGMIWIFHIQYKQPPSFYLKSPTLLYVFIFIALRTLRFEARYVIAAGLVAAAGWLALAVYAVQASGGMLHTRTRDYVEYLTSNQILLGAEFDKIITILTVTAILAVAINRARGLLVESVAESVAARDLSRFFSPEIARKITAAEQEITAGQGQVREAAILMVDIRGFTRLASTIKPDDLMAILAQYQSRMVPIIQNHGGTIDKFMGDGIMATFGAAATSTTYAADCLRAVDDIIREARDWNHELESGNRQPLRIGAAVATGEIVFGAVGDATRMEYTVIGDAVNLSAKLEKHTKSEGVQAICTEEAYKIAEKQDYRPSGKRIHLNARHIEGVVEPVDIVVLAA